MVAQGIWDDCGRVRKNSFIALAAFLVATQLLRGIDLTWNYAVEIAADVQASPAQITLRWKQDTSATPTSYAVYRKAPAATAWGNPVATLPGSVTSFVDTGVAAGTVYEYQIIKDAMATEGIVGYGYIQAGISVPLVDNRGTVILIVERTYAANLAAELARLQQDLVGDGWTVLRHDVGRTDSVVSVKALIRADYLADPANVNSVFLFGRVPVPYSGVLNPDGHPEHLGAWPADVYYGDMDGQWTDSTVNFQQTDNSDPADAARLTNVPGDGKFDQTTIPGPVKLKVGRVDLSNMPGYLDAGSNPSFPSEQELLRQYLNKDHNFRHTLITAKRRSLMGDYSGDKEGLAVAASGFRSFAPLFGIGAGALTNLNIQYNDAHGWWLPTLKTDDYLFALGCGAGSYTTVSGLGPHLPYNDATTTDIVSNDIRAVVVMLFGSWCGDWDHQDNIVRSVLATPTYGLAAVYTGVPHWFFHPLGLGETLGYCARLTQNNTDPGLYRSWVNPTANMVDIALMGDPTLRLFTVAPASALSGTAGAGQVTLTWSASTDASVSGYHVYRAASAAGPFTRLTSSPIGATTFTDASATSGATYQVRAVKLETTASGTFFNSSQGIFYTVGGVTGGPPPPPPPVAASSRLINLSVRSFCGTGSQSLTVGFVVAGGDASASAPFLIRATGPALRTFGVDGVLADPVVTVYHDSTIVATNDNWGAQAAQISAVASAVGAFRLPDTTSTDAALTTSFGAAPYSAQVAGADGGSGVALAEVYDATAAGNVTANTPRLINISARALAGTGSNVLTVGFVIAGSTSEKVLIRGIGPGLARFGVTGVLSHPQLKLIDANNGTLATNSGWAGDATLAATFTQVGAFALDANSADSALIATLQPGAYSAQIISTDGTTGVALAEVYEVK